MQKTNEEQSRVWQRDRPGGDVLQGQQSDRPLWGCCLATWFQTSSFSFLNFNLNTGKINTLIELSLVHNNDKVFSTHLSISYYDGSIKVHITYQSQCGTWVLWLTTPYVDFVKSRS